MLGPKSVSPGAADDIRGTQTLFSQTKAVEEPRSGGYPPKGFTNFGPRILDNLMKQVKWSGLFCSSVRPYVCMSDMAFYRRSKKCIDLFVHNVQIYVS